jgi:hypothetical protein
MSWWLVLVFGSVPWRNGVLEEAERADLTFGVEELVNGRRKGFRILTVFFSTLALSQPLMMSLGWYIIGTAVLRQ